MTRDTQGLLDDRDGNDADVYAALWASAPFPRIPNDTPNELRSLTVDVDDPKRIYAIHHAARRHHFHILVERYILQLRYGCQNKSCNTSTCFSCRKRLAAGAPVRRYNSTSARTLAVYLSSQDNPEQGLCHNLSAERPTPQIKKASKVATRKDGAGRSERIGGHTGIGHVGPSKKSGNIDGSIGEPATPSAGLTSPSQQQTEKEVKENIEKKADLRSIVKAVDEVTTTDHKSFVQNVFGTVAFKMLEWLTPRNLDIMAAAREHDLKTAAEAPLSSTKEKPTPSSKLSDHSNEDARKEPKLKPSPESSKTGAKELKSSEPRELTKPHAAKPKATLHEEVKPYTSTTSRTNSDTKATHIPSHNKRKKSESAESQPPKGILNISTSPKKSDSVPEIKPLPRDFIHVLPGRKETQQTTRTGRKVQVVNAAPITNDTQASTPIISPSPTPNLPEDPQVHEDETLLSKIPTGSSPEPKASSEEHIDNPNSIKTSEPDFPQSLSRLTFEIIDLICDILQNDDTAEKHNLLPERIQHPHIRYRDKQLLRRPVTPGYPKSLKLQWCSFIEQSLFYVLSGPESLLLSFGNEQYRLYDSQTVWYLMLRMTRVTPSLVLDSLWISAESLFLPPQKIENIHEWPREAQRTSGRTSLSNLDAAKVINLCLHALVAVVPLLENERQLANMSRIRSYGQTMPGKDMATLEPPSLCLQYEDAFTNDLALRLARRVFAAIPTRRRFTELLELQREIRTEGRREEDILEIVLSELRFLDLGTPSVLNYTDDERDLHERRVPTLILDWARTVMLQDWQSTAEVPADGPFGGALAMIAAIYKNRKSLLLGDIHFRSEYFAERLDPVEMPLEWLNFESNRRSVHLLDHPYLFTPSTLVTYFRAINYSRMNQAYETAKATYGLMRAISSEGNLMTDQERRMSLFERLGTATSKFMVLEISRENVLQDTFNSIWRREERELMRPLKIRLGEETGEEGMDSGGVQQEFFRLAIAEALNPDYGTFTIDDRTKMTWFQPGSPEPLWKFELIGMIISLAVYNGLTLPVTFPKALYQKLLDEDVSELHHISDGWPDLANGLTTLLEWDESDGLIEDIFARTYEFSVEQFGLPVSREMTSSTHWPQFADLYHTSNPTDAPLVTNENRNAYVSDYIRWLTDISIRPQFEAFKSGFFTCIDRRSISLFDTDTLQSLVEGVQEIDIAELRRATRYIGWEGGSSHRTIRDFWSIVKRYDLEHRKKLLEFVTASDRVPVGGMKNLQFNLQKHGVDDDHLPSSYTCYGVLLLPEYSSKEVLRRKLEMALENSKGFGFA